jgi:hypothetical protein
MGGTGACPLVRERADHRGQLGFDQSLVDRLDSLADPVINVRGLHYLQNFWQCRLVQGHRVLVSFRENHWRDLADHHTVAPPGMRRQPSRPTIYTTREDAADLADLALSARRDRP